MTKTRIPIPDELAAKVMFASDRTCCVCRDQTRKTEIHHIDGDPSNNDFSNLAVMCKDHQSDAHTNHAFARNLSADTVRLYNETWREIVKLRLSPDSTTQHREYTQEVLLDISLACHSWKNQYMALYPGHFRDVGGVKKYGDVWDMLRDAPNHKFTEQEWDRYLPLFKHSVVQVISRLEQIVAQHHDVIPTEVKTLLIREIRQLLVERDVYVSVAKELATGNDMFFAVRFLSILGSLSNIDRLVKQTRKSLGTKDT